MATFHAIWTVLLAIIFVGIVVWAWSGKRAKAFDEAARLPLEDEEYIEVEPTSGEKNHG